MSKSKWYQQGADDARADMFDPPWNPGHRDYERYVEGHRDAQAEIKREIEDEEEMMRVGNDGRLVPKRWRE